MKISDILFLRYSPDGGSAIGLAGGAEVASGLEPPEVLRLLCRNSGNDFDSCLRTMKSGLRVAQKPPVRVGGFPPVYLFPTHRPDSRRCAWLAYAQIVGCQGAGDNSLIRFADGSTIVVEVGERAIRRGLRLCRSLTLRQACPDTIDERIISGLN